ncbi:hypothetical protein [Mycobacterium sp. 1274761.0]|uniref:hypothetical protein n=1 Tax=Mycobacterium sp. 1274761.0 TaxID=1834077 RepID=UPI00350F49C8
MMVAAAMCSTGVAMAAPSSTGSASDVVQSLKDEGFAVMINGTVTGSLSNCVVTGVHNPATSNKASGFTTVYVDVDCPDTNN